MSDRRKDMGIPGRGSLQPMTMIITALMTIITPGWMAMIAFAESETAESSSPVLLI